MGNNEICLQRSEKMVSVIVPIYNIRPDILQKCLDSLRNQTFSKYEVLLVDDGSEAYVAEVCLKYREKDERVCYVRQENRGLAGARNTGVCSAKGEYLCFVDPDDWLDPAYLETLYDLISRTSADIAVIDAVVHYRTHTADNHFLSGPERVLAGSEKNALLYQLLSKKICIYYPPEIAAGVTWAKIYRRHFLEKNEIWSVEGLNRMQDNVLNMYAFEHACSIAYKPVCLYHYRKVEGSASNRFNPHIVDDFEQYYREAAKYLYNFQKEQELWEALYMKELTSFHSYLRYYYFHRDSGFTRSAADRKVRELLEREPYRTALRHINTKYLTRQEYAFVFALSRHLFGTLRIMIGARNWGKEHRICGF